MPQLFEYDTIEENLVLAKELKLDFIELNLNFSYCRKEMEEGKLAALLKKYGLEATLHFYDEADFASYDEVVDAYLQLLDKYAKLGKGYIKLINIHNNPGPVVTISGVKNYIYDKEYCEYIVNSLNKLSNSTMTIGLISHIPELQEKIKKKFIIEKATEKSGSKVRYNETY